MQILRVNGNDVGENAIKIYTNTQTCEFDNERGFIDGTVKVTSEVTKDLTI